MATGYDGSIKFDTSINPKGFNAGIQRLSNSIKGVMTSISKGFGNINASISKAGAAATGALKEVLLVVGEVVAAVGTALSVVIGVVAAIVLLAAALVGAGIAIFSWAQKFTATLYKTLDTTSAYRDKVLELKTAFDTLKGAMTSLGTTLLSAIAPALMKVIDWLVKAINYVSMFIAALRGQTAVMQYVSGSAEGAARSTGAAADNAERLAKNTKKAGEAAKGALAGFDQLNVLQMAEDDKQDTSSSGGGTGGNMVLQEVPIDQGILEKAEKIREAIEKIKTWFKTAWENIKLWATAAWNWIVKIWGIAWTWFKSNIIDPLVLGFTVAWAWVKQAATDAWNWIKTAWENAGLFFSSLWGSIVGFATSAWQSIVDVWGLVSAWFMNNVITPLLNFFKPIFTFIAILANNAWVTIKYIWGIVSQWFKTNVIDPLVASFTEFWGGLKESGKACWDAIVAVWTVVSGWFKTNVTDPLKEKFLSAWNSIKLTASGTWKKISAVWMVVSGWFKLHVTDPLKDAFKTALDWINDKFETIFTGIKDFVKGIINGLIGLINGMLNGAVSGINSLIGSANTAGKNIPGWISIPTVTAPQIPLLAKGAVIPPNSQFAAILGDQTSGRNIETPEALMRQIVREEMGNAQPQQLTINFGGNMAALIRQMKPYIDQENVRVGASLVSSGATS